MRTWANRGGSARTAALMGSIAALASGTSTASAAPDGLAPPPDAPMGAGLGLQDDIDPVADTVCPAGDTLFGIDVSKWQGQINWAQVKNAGVHYAIIRATHGLNIVDEWFETNWEQAHANGIVAGVYQYFEPAQDPIAQADLMLAMMGELQPGDLPPVIDVESATNSTPAQTANAIRAWVDHVEEATGLTPIIYTGRYFWQDNVQSNEFVDHPLWIAHYTTGCPNIPAPWGTWAFHQYSSTGSVAGVAGNVDTNTFNGNMDDLMAMTLQDLAPPSGGLDGASCDGVSGYAIDPKAEGPTEVLVSFGGPASDPNAIVIPAVASLPHLSACDDGGCDHGFEVAVPWSRRDGQEHAVHVQLANADADAIVVAPSAIACDADLSGVRLRPIDAAGLAAWRFDEALDILALGADKAPAPDDEVFAPMPVIVKGETFAGTWWIDRGVRRAVDPSAAAAWGIDLGAAMTWPDASVQDVPEGDPMPSARRAVRIDGATYVVDGEVANAGDDGGAHDDAGHDDVDDGDGAADDSPSDDGDTLPSLPEDADDGRGCAIASPDRGPAALMFLLTALFGRARRRR